jgi:hypothetical protein
MERHPRHATSEAAKTEKPLPLRVFGNAKAELGSVLVLREGLQCLSESFFRFESRFKARRLSILAIEFY